MLIAIPLCSALHTDIFGSESFDVEPYLGAHGSALVYHSLLVLLSSQDHNAGLQLCLIEPTEKSNL